MSIQHLVPAELPQEIQNQVPPSWDLYFSRKEDKDRHKDTQRAKSMENISQWSDGDREGKESGGNV